MIERVVLVSPRGFCAGVVRAIETVQLALERFRPPVYVRRSIVHNAHVADRLRAAGALFVDELDEVPDGAVVVFGAHGVPAAVEVDARARHLHVLDATCPLVAKVHREVRRYRREGFDVVLIGHAGHDEVVGVLGQAPGVQLVERAADVAGVHVARPDRVACVTQTTLRHDDVAPVLDALLQRFPAMTIPKAADICYATRNRQAAIEWLAARVDVVVVVGDERSSNSRRLCEAAAALGTASHLVATADEIDDVWFTGSSVVGVTAGASTPEDLVGGVVARLCEGGATLESDVFREERTAFRLPPELVLAGDR